MTDSVFPRMDSCKTCPSKRKPTGPTENIYRFFNVSVCARFQRGVPKPWTVIDVPIHSFSVDFIHV